MLFRSFVQSAYRVIVFPNAGYGSGRSIRKEPVAVLFVYIKNCIDLCRIVSQISGNSKKISGKAFKFKIMNKYCSKRKNVS